MSHLSSEMSERVSRRRLVYCPFPLSGRVSRAFPRGDVRLVCHARDRKDKGRGALRGTCDTGNPRRGLLASWKCRVRSVSRNKCNEFVYALEQLLLLVLSWTLMFFVVFICIFRWGV